MSQQDIAKHPFDDGIGADQASKTHLLGILEVIEADSSVSQRKIAEELGIALGMVNHYLRWCVQKGWIKISRIPAKRYAYYITPQGFLEKSTLVGTHIQKSFSLFRHAREECTKIYASLLARHINKVILVGAGDLQEFASMIAEGNDIECIKIKSMADINQLAVNEAILLTDMNNSQLTYNALIKNFPETKIFTPSFLRINKGELHG